MTPKFEYGQEIWYESDDGPRSGLVTCVQCGCCYEGFRYRVYLEVDERYVEDVEEHQLSERLA